MKLYCNSCDGIYDSVDIRFTKACDNDCSFCIEKGGLSSLGDSNVKEIVKSTLDTGIKDVLILGGEPLLQPNKVLEYITAIRKNVNTIYLTTSLPKTIGEHPYIIYKIFDLLDGINVSVHHYDSAINNSIFVASSNHDRLEMLKDLNTKFGSKIRTSINLVQEGIDSKTELLKMLDILQSIGCIHIKINELQNVGEKYVSFEDIMNKSLPKPFSNGCSTYIEMPPYTPEMKILLKRSCFLVEQSREASVMDIAKLLLRHFFPKHNNFKVVYESGLTKKGWNHEN